jgi:hypothetical protein
MIEHEIKLLFCCSLYFTAFWDWHRAAKKKTFELNWENYVNVKFQTKYSARRRSLMCNVMKHAGSDSLMPARFVSRNKRERLLAYF